MEPASRPPLQQKPTTRHSLQIIALVLALAAGSAWAEPKFPAAPEPASSVNDPVAPAPPAISPVGAPSPMPPPAVSMKWAGARLAGAVIAVGLLLVGAVVGYRKVLDRVGRRAGGRGRRRARQGWWSFWVPDATAEADRIYLASRRHLGPRESLGVVRVGRERFLIGITGGSISLLARLDESGRAAEGAEPDAADFALELDEATTKPHRGSRRPQGDGSGSEAGSVFLRPPTDSLRLASAEDRPAASHSHADLADPATVKPVPTDFTARIARSRDRLARIGHLRAVTRESRD